MKFALISEGITDQVVIESIIEAHYRDSDEELIVNPLQPMRDATDQSRQDPKTPGGWENVFDYISRDDNCASALDLNDKLIIQIDSDIYRRSTTHIDPNTDHETLFNILKNLLISKIPINDFEHLKDFLIFAIPIHSTECWLIPLYTNNEITLKKINNCKDVLDKIEQNVVKKVENKVEKTFDCYKKLSAKIKRPKDIKLISKHNKSLSLFIQQLPALENKE